MWVVTFGPPSMFVGIMCSQTVQALMGRHNHMIYDNVLERK